MPEITVSMAAGRTDEQKAGMMRDITQALVKNLGVDADAVVIQINEAPLAHKMKGGKTFVERAARLRGEEVTRPPFRRPCERRDPIIHRMLVVTRRLRASSLRANIHVRGYGSRLKAGTTSQKQWCLRIIPWTHANSSRSA